MKDYTKLLTQEQKEQLCYLHWEEGTMYEESYYLELMENNELLRKIYIESLEKTCRNHRIPYEKDKNIYELNYEFDYDEFDELLLDFMAELDEVLGVGLYE